MLPTLDFELGMAAAGVLCLVLMSLVQDGSQQVGKVSGESLAVADWRILTGSVGQEDGWERTKLLV